MTFIKMNNTPLVSIIIPTLNSEKYLDETILSVINQTYNNIECIVIDGISTDGTLDILKSYEHKILWISEKDQGQSDAINKGFKMCHGEICTWLGSDDILMTNAVETVVKVFHDKNEVGLVYGNLEINDAMGNSTKVVKAKLLTLDVLLNIDQSVIQAGSFYRTELVRKVGYLDASLHYVMDYDLFLRLLMISEAVAVNVTMAKFRMWGANKSDSLGRLMSSVEGFEVSKRYGSGLLTPLNMKRARAVIRYYAKRILGVSLYARLRHPLTHRVDKNA